MTSIAEHTAQVTPQSTPMISEQKLRPLRICFVCDEYPPALHGGIGTLIQALGRGLVAEGHEVRVIGISPKDSQAADYEEDQGVKVWRLRTGRERFRWLGARYKLYREVSKWCSKGEVDLVEVVDFAGPAAMWPRLPVPLIARIHGSTTFFASEVNRPLRRSDYWFERASLRRAKHFCALTKYAADRTKDLFKMGEVDVHVLYNFITHEIDAPAGRRDGSSVVFTGTLTYKKGVVPLIEAWKSVIEQRPDARLHIYGKDGRTKEGGSMKEMLIEQLPPDARDSVIFHGHTTRDELFTALAEARVGVFPSYSETFGLAPAESMAAGCPTIYSNCGCGGELVRDDIDGLLIDPDEPDALATAMMRLLNDDELADRLGKAGQQRIRESFSLESQLPKNIEFYRQCLEGSANYRADK